MNEPSKRRARFAAFDHDAAQYDAWYDRPKGKRLFLKEVMCLRTVLTPAPSRPWLEVGVGTGRFAKELGIDEGFDCAAEPLLLAGRRGIRVHQGNAQRLPFENGRFGALFLIMTLCFLEKPLSALREAARVLRPGGSVVIGFVPRDSAWGRAYLKKAGAGHPYYKDATFRTVAEVRRLASRAGLYEAGISSCHLGAPEGADKAAASRVSVAADEADFVVLRFDV